MMFRTLVLWCLTASVGICQTSQGRLSKEELADMRARYAELNGQTFALHGNPELGKAYDESPEKVAAIRKDLLGLVRKAVTKSLSSGTTETQIRDVIHTVQGEYSFDAGWPDGTNTPFTHSFTLGGKAFAASAYVIMEGGEGIPQSQSFLDFYVERNGEWNLKAIGGTEFGGSTFDVAPIPAGLAGESWFLAWGMVIGNTRGMLTARIYAFNGEEVREVWKREEIPYGDIQVSGNTVAISYYKHGYDPAPTVDMLHVTANGLQ